MPKLKSHSGAPKSGFFKTASGKFSATRGPASAI